MNRGDSGFRKIGERSAIEANIKLFLEPEVDLRSKERESRVAGRDSYGQSKPNGHRAV